MKKGTLMFIIFAGIWEIAVAVIYGLFFSYNEADIAAMENGTAVFPYRYAAGSTTNFLANTTQFPFPLAVVAVAIVLLVVGLAMVTGYIEGSVITGMASTLLIFALTVQNFFIFRDFWNRVGINNAAASVSLSGFDYPRINYVNFKNDLQTSYELPTASLLDAVGAALAIYAGYTGVVGRIGLGEVFFLSWIGTFAYEVNSQLLWRLFIPDNGYPSRAFGFGGMLGLISSIVLSKRELTAKNPRYKSSYKIMALALLGTIFVWCSFPVLVLSNVFTSTTGKIVGMAGQVNIWLALASSVLGSFAASSLAHEKLSIHDLVFSALAGAIAFSSSTDVNYNPGAATAISFAVGFVISFSQSKLKKKINSKGVVDSNSVVFQFLVPSLLAALFSAILQGLGQSSASYTLTSYISANSTFTTSNVNYPANRGQGRTDTDQGLMQIAGWGISVALGAVAGLLIGLVYRLLNDNFTKLEHFFNDASVYKYPKIRSKEGILENKELIGEVVVKQQREK